MKRKKSPLQHRKGGTSTDSSDSSKLSSHQSSSVLMSSPAVLHPPSFYVGTPPSLGAASSHPAVNNSVDEWGHMDDTGENEGLSGSLPSLGSNDGLHLMLDETDCGSSNVPDLHRTKAAIEHLQQKISRTKELIKTEQKARDENVNEYLKLATNADKQQLQRIKSVFEKKNQKSAQLITQLQKKLENYNKRIRDLETHGLPRSALRDMGQGLKYTSDEENSSVTSESAQNHNTGEGTHQSMASPHHHHHHHHHHLGLQNLPSSSDSATLQSLGPVSVDLEPILQELRSQRDEYQHLVEEIESVKGQIQQESTYFSQALQEERYRYERLEEQMNDLIELHQNEIENLKQGIADMEEKVQYQSEERLRDVHDVLENCQTRISRMEHQQHQHLQQLVSLDAVENSQARALLLKLINVALTVLQVILLLVATLSNIIMPFLRTRVRTLTTLLLIVVIVMVCHQWPELVELCRSKAEKVIKPLISK